MGIVVTFFMLLGLLMLSPLSWLSLGTKKRNPYIANFIGVGLLVAGLWNVFWYALRHLQDFWGIAALVSGVFMVLAALDIIRQYASQSISDQRIFKLAYQAARPLAPLWTLGLLVSFLLYGVTLIRLNLGLSII